ncbi:unnamed protein product, partial [Urochloa humidicola]
AAAQDPATNAAEIAAPRPSRAQPGRVAATPPPGRPRAPPCRWGWRGWMLFAGARGKAASRPRSCGFEEPPLLLRPLLLAAGRARGGGMAVPSAPLLLRLRGPRVV